MKPEQESIKVEISHPILDCQKWMYKSIWEIRQERKKKKENRDK